MSATRTLPGLAVLIAIAFVSYWIADGLTMVNALFVAIAIGVVFGNTVGVPKTATRGVRTHKLWLEAGIVLMGARLSLSSVARAGPRIVVVVLAMLLFTVLFVELLSRLVLDSVDKTSSLLAAGMSICGVSAVVALAGAIKPDDEQVAYAVATILLFDAITLFVYPSVGHVLHLPTTVFGVWAGASMFSTGPVAAAGFAYAPTSGRWAVLTKLTRNVFLGVIVVAYSVYYARVESDESRRTNWNAIWREFPTFVLGFLLLIVAASSGVFTQHQISTLTAWSDWLFLVAFAGLGLEMNVREMGQTGIKPLLVVLGGFVAASSLSLVLVHLLFG